VNTVVEGPVGTHDLLALSKQCRDALAAHFLDEPGGSTHDGELAAFVACVLVSAQFLFRAQFHRQAQLQCLLSHLTASELATS
jgi:hypothetical protein